MKIRIKGNTVRFRLTQSEVSQLCTSGKVIEETKFSSCIFGYTVKSTNQTNLNIDFSDNKIELEIPEKLLKDWDTNNKVGFYENLKTSKGDIIVITLEKDFSCLDDRGEDESDNYPNPKATNILMNNI